MSCPHPFLVDQRAYIRPTSASSNRSSTSSSSSSSTSRSETISPRIMDQQRERAHATALQALQSTSRRSCDFNQTQIQRARANEISESIIQSTISVNYQFGSVQPRSRVSSSASASVSVSAKEIENEDKKARRKGMMARLCKFISIFW